MKKIIFLLLLSVFLFACELDNPKEVEYKVTCTATPNLVDLTIENEDGRTSQFSDVATPWTYTFDIEKDDYGVFVYVFDIEKDDYGVFVYVSAQNQQDHGSVTATIYVDGSQFKTSTSTGAYVIATASGSVEW